MNTCLPISIHEPFVPQNNLLSIRNRSSKPNSCRVSEWMQSWLHTVRSGETLRVFLFPTVFLDFIRVFSGILMWLKTVHALFRELLLKHTCGEIFVGPYGGPSWTGICQWNKVHSTGHDLRLFNAVQIVEAHNCPWRNFQNNDTVWK